MSPVEELERRLAAAPSDAATALVLADALTEAGDPRGEVIALEHGVATSPPAEARALELKLAALVAREGRRLIGRPGGFLFRAAFGPRDYVRYGVGGAHLTNAQTLRAPSGTALYAEVRAFLERFTDAPGPEMLNLYALRTRLDALDELTPRLQTLLGDGRLTERTIWRRSSPSARPAAHGPLGELLVALEHDVDAPLGATLGYRFRLTHPGTTIPLPYQEAAFTPTGEPLESALVVDLGARDQPVPLLPLHRLRRRVLPPARRHRRDAGALLLAEGLVSGEGDGREAGGRAEGDPRARQRREGYFFGCFAMTLSTILS